MEASIKYCYNLPLHLYDWSKRYSDVEIPYYQTLYELAPLIYNYLHVYADCSESDSNDEVPYYHTSSLCSYRLIKSHSNNEASCY